MAYATLAQLEAYVADSPVIIDDPALAERELERASRDVDNYIGAARPFHDSGWRFDPDNVLTLMTFGEISALQRATCAQAQWRLFKGPDYFLEDDPGTVTGPDFTIEAHKPRRYSAQMILELRLGGLTITGARAVP